MDLFSELSKTAETEVDYTLGDKPLILECIECGFKEQIDEADMEDWEMTGEMECSECGSMDVEVYGKPPRMGKQSADRLYSAPACQNCPSNTLTAIPCAEVGKCYCANYPDDCDKCGSLSCPASPSCENKTIEIQSSKTADSTTNCDVCGKPYSSQGPDDDEFAGRWFCWCQECQDNGKGEEADYNKTYENEIEPGLDSGDMDFDGEVQEMMLKNMASKQAFIDEFRAETSGKKLIVQVKGMAVLIGEPQAGKKPKLIDMAFGDSNAIIQDLKSQGYEVEIIKTSKTAERLFKIGDEVAGKAGVGGTIQTGVVKEVSFSWSKGTNFYGVQFKNGVFDYLSEEELTIVKYASKTAESPILWDDYEFSGGVENVVYIMYKGEVVDKLDTPSLVDGWKQATNYDLKYDYDEYNYNNVEFYNNNGELIDTLWLDDLVQSWLQDSPLHKLASKISGDGVLDPNYRDEDGWGENTEPACKFCGGPIGDGFYSLQLCRQCFNDAERESLDNIVDSIPEDAVDGLF